jgi:hypothetical protein
LHKFQSPLKRSPPSEPHTERCSVSRTLLLVSQRPQEGSPPSWFLDGAPMERDAHSQSLHEFNISWNPHLALLQHVGKKYCHLPRSPTWTEGLHTKGCGLVPQGSHLRHCCWLPQCHAPFHVTQGADCQLVSGHPVTPVNMCQCNPLRALPPRPLQSPHNPWGWGMGWIYGRPSASYFWQQLEPQCLHEFVRQESHCVTCRSWNKVWWKNSVLTQI